MKASIVAGRTLFITGPAALTHLAGKASVLAAPLTLGQKLTIRRWRALPVFCEEKSSFNLTLGPEATAQDLEGNTVPQSWENAAETALRAADVEQVVLLVIGGPDVGKTSFSVFLVNRALKWQNVKSVNIIDADIGQSDIGPPATVGTYHAIHPIFDLFYETACKTVFIGATNPALVQERMLDVTSRLCAESQRQFSLTILNTDGWIEGDDACAYKQKLAHSTKANFAVILNESEGADCIVSRLKTESCYLLKVGRSPVTLKRSREERKALRMQAYWKSLQNMVVRSIPLSGVELAGSRLRSCGVLLGLYDEMGYVGIGILKDVDEKTLKVVTPVRQRIERIEFGFVTVDLQLQA